MGKSQGPFVHDNPCVDGPPLPQMAATIFSLLCCPSPIHDRDTPPVGETVGQANQEGDQPDCRCFVFFCGLGFFLL